LINVLRSRISVRSNAYKGDGVVRSKTVVFRTTPGRLARVDDLVEALRDPDSTYCRPNRARVIELLIDLGLEHIADRGQ
jgi:hypothetical protein